MTCMLKKENWLKLENFSRYLISDKGRMTIYGGINV